MNSRSQYKPFSTARLIRGSLRYYWRSNVAVVLGVAVAVAVLIGSLLVGDSVRGSLRDLALERLGRTECALRAGRFFREELAADLLKCVEFGRAFDMSVPAIILEGTAGAASGGAVVPAVTVVGVRDDFQGLWQAAPAIGLHGRRVIVNQALAEDVGVGEGDAILLTVGRRGAAPTETVFGRRSREHTVHMMRGVVARVIPSRGPGMFSLRGDRTRPRNVYVSLSWLQRQLKRDGRANTILAGRTRPSRARAPSQETLDNALAQVVKIEDLGLRLPPNEEQGYVSLESTALVLSSVAVEAARNAAKENGQSAALTSVYLANSLMLIKDGKPGPSVPYSVVAGLDPRAGPPFGPLPMAEGSARPALGQEGVLLNAWAAEDLGARAGDTIEMAWYVAGARGRLREVTRRFTLRGIVAMAGRALDRGLVPDFEGMTDADTMRDWDPPFPVDLKRIRPKDEAYWRKYGTTPKAFVSLDTARSMWLSPRPGAPASAGTWVTSMRVAPAEGARLKQSATVFREQLLRHLRPSDFGLRFRPVKEEALAAAKGSTDFSVLFLGMSMFLVASAAGLVGLLLRLTVERRASQSGILVATGFTPAAVARILMGEGMGLALAGVLAGVPLGVGYAWLVIYALRTWWAGAVADFVFSLHVGGLSLAIGSAAGLVVAAGAIRWSAGVLRRIPALSLLAGWRALGARPGAGFARRVRWIGWASLVIAALLLVLSGGLDVVPATGAFFGVGTALLVGALALLCAHLQRSAGFQPAARKAEGASLSLALLAWRGASRNWLRSLLTVGLVACASFLIVAVAANRKDPARLNTRRTDSGAGGFNLVGKSALPMYHDLNSDEGRRALGFAPEASRVLAQSRIMPFRMSRGDDVSCLNLQRPGAPRVLGVPHELVSGRKRFSFTKVGAKEANPWRLLERPVTDDGAGPVVAAFADAASAQWILHVGPGDVIEVPGDRGRTVWLGLAGTLRESIFASQVLISEENFRRHFGSDSGYRYFLIETPAGQEKAVAAVLRENLGELGFDVTRTADVLAAYARVQNTYLSTFQTLGGLGLLLGTFGVVAVLLRGVMERRSELAMMLALGFKRGRLVGMILMENGLLLVIGVIIGAAAALVAVSPHLVSTSADVKWTSLGGTLAACVLVGCASCAVAASASVRKDLLSALRSE